MDAKEKQALIKLVGDSLKSIDPYDLETIEAALKKPISMNDSFFLKEKLEVLSQGDIIKSVPYIGIDPNTQKGFVNFFDSIVLSNTCDCQRKNNIILAPILSEGFSEIQKTGNINSKYELFYIPEKEFKTCYIDFSRIFSFPLNVLKKRFEEKKSDRLYSLSFYGFNFFYLKLSVYLFRPESDEIAPKRDYD